MAATAHRVLLVEDSPAMRALVGATLEDAENIQVVEAVSGFEALKLLPRQSFDLIITDINMPDINGLELINFVKKNPNYRDVPLIIISTEGTDRDREKGLKLGAVAYLTKPFEPSQLLDHVRRHLGIG